MNHVDFPAFRPALSLRNPHAQTIAAIYLQGQAAAYRAIQRDVVLDDGDVIVLHDDCPRQWHNGDRIVLLLHGVAGCHLSSYMIRVAAKLNTRGVRTFRLDLRAHGAGVTKARGIGHAGRSEDVAATVKYTEELCSQSPITLVGFSMSGNIVLKYLGEMGARTPGPVDSAIAVAPPIDLMDCGRNLRRGANRIYDCAFVQVLQRLVRERQRMIPELPQIPVSRLPNRLWQFDDCFTAPLSGFTGVEDYYTRCSAGPLLSKVQTPTLLLTSEDDPLVPVGMFNRFQFSSSIDLRVTRRGGHMGFIGVKGVDPDQRWMDWRLVEWILRQDCRKANCRSLRATAGDRSLGSDEI